MQYSATLAARCLRSFTSSGPAAPRSVAHQAVSTSLLVLRGVSHRPTIRAQAARVIAVTALHFGAR